jgi:hypothetical protein
VLGGASGGDDGATGEAGAGSTGDNDPTEPAGFAVEACSEAPFTVPAVDAPPLDTPAPTGTGAATLSAAPQSSQYSAPAGLSCWQT